MSKKSCTPNDNHSPALSEQGPAFPKNGSELIKALKKAVDQAECPPGGHLTQKRFGELIGIPKSTIHDWFYGRLADQIRVFVCGLERLDEQQRSDLLCEFCRECPRLNHARLADDPGSVGTLMALVQQQTGLTLVSSRSDKARTFLVTAMGNSAGGAVRVSGLDVHCTSQFVPVSGVFYLGSCKCPTEVRAAVRRLWPVVVDSDARILIFNGLCNAAPEFQPRMLALAKTRNVIIADDPTMEIPTLNLSPGVAATRVRVEQMEKEQLRLTVQIRSTGSY